MLLWLAEAAGVPAEQVGRADRALRRLVGAGWLDSNPRCRSAVRAMIPWAEIEKALIQAGHLHKPPKNANFTAARRT
jgi:hypothetical protein